MKMIFQGSNPIAMAAKSGTFGPIKIRGADSNKKPRIKKATNPPV